jgi:hypothetical protein
VIMSNNRKPGQVDNSWADRARVIDHSAAPVPFPYEPPRLTGKQALARVTLYSFACTPGDPNCHVGHP